MGKIENKEYSFSFIIESMSYVSGLYRSVNLKPDAIKERYAVVLPYILEKLNINSIEPHLLCNGNLLIASLLGSPSYYFITCKGKHGDNKIDISIKKILTKPQEQETTLRHIGNCRTIHKSKIPYLILQLLEHQEPHNHDVIIYAIKKTSVEAEITFDICDWEIHLNTAKIQKHKVKHDVNISINIRNET